MSNEEFDNLKQELIWEGSKVAVLSSTEQARAGAEACATPASHVPLSRSASWRLRWRLLRASPS